MPRDSRITLINHVRTLCSQLVSEQLQQWFYHAVPFVPWSSNRNLAPPTTTNLSPKFSTCWYLCRMRNDFTLTWAILTFVLSIKHVSAFSPVLTARQSLACGTIICPNPDWLWNNAAPAAAGFGTWSLNQFQSDDPLTIPTDKPDKNRKPSPSTQLDVELWGVGDQLDVNDCVAVDISAADNPPDDDVTHSRLRSFLKYFANSWHFSLGKFKS